MKNLLLLTIICLSIVGTKAQATFHQLGNSKTANQFAEAPQKYANDLKQLRGFGCFLEINKSDKNYDNLVRFYEKGKDGNNFLIFFITVEIVNEKGKTIAKSNTRKVKISPNKKTMFNELLFPGDQADQSFPGDDFFPGDLFDKLDKGQYELKFTATPAEKKVKNLVKMGEPKTPLIFKK